ncbi:SDR family oxidoreductase [Spirillospora albida]|uniref:SDR family oxidoreductase n=1 Tax=Spirillospora albida TaxID=58123 RepID=UPI00068BFC25
MSAHIGLDLLERGVLAALDRRSPAWTASSTIITEVCREGGAIAVDAETALPTEHRRSIAEQLGRQCIPRRGRPDDVAAAALFLATPAAAFITGQTLHVDGGWILH